MKILDLRAVPTESVARFASNGFSVASVGRVQEGHLAFVRLEADGRIGRHPAVGHQLLLLVSGDATVSGQDEVTEKLEPGQAAVWAPGEEHETLSTAGMTAFIVEGSTEFDLHD
jgi:quercetin dioxygenase-like cupin family protein